MMRESKHSKWRVVGLAIVCCAASQAAIAQQIFAYPNVGQSPEQQSKDRYECHQWSVAQSGYDPSTAPPIATAPSPNQAYGYADQPPPTPARQGGFLGLGDGGFFRGGGMVGDAATGAALGAAGGAIAGDAGEGAAIGALASTVFGAVSRSTNSAQQTPSRNAYQQQQYEQNHYAQQQARIEADQAHQDRMHRNSNYNQAFGACMKARNYSVN